jgi:hypothetical protein
MSKSILRHILACVCGLALLAGCGGGADSSVTTLQCTPAPCSVAGLEVSLPNPFVQQFNNLQVVVDSGPANIFSLVANVLYATVTVCAPGARPGDPPPSKCATIDHVQVDTGSVGLRIVASKVGSLGLIPVNLAATGTTVAGQAHECYPFVIGGLWGPTAVADVGVAQQWATSVPMQLIQDDPQAAIQVPADCSKAVNGTVLSSVSALGSNGILGIGSVTLDCGEKCRLGNYVDPIDPSKSFVQYYSCPPGAASVLNCSAAAVGANQQTYNPVAALPKDPSNNNLADNNGVVLMLPPVLGLGAAKVHGELILGINTRPNNQLDAGASKVHLGVDFHNNYKSYLNVTTQYNNQTIYNSYLDTGTNGLFFTDNAITRCPSTAPAPISPWYCPALPLKQSAIVADGGNLPLQNPVTVLFNVGNANNYFLTSNTAFGDLVGAPDAATASAPSFSWGLPFFYGRRVALSIWDPCPTTAPCSKDPEYSAAPWYSFKGQ